MILARLLWLQVFQHGDYIRLAQGQQDRQVEIQAPRGAIFDRNGQHLAMSLPVDSVCINPLRIPDLAFAADLLEKALGVDGNALLVKMASAVDAKRGFLWVKRKITPEESRKLRSYGLDWVEFRTESSRFYPKGTLAANLIGSVDHDQKGNAGIEQSFDKELEGRSGSMRTTSDVKQRVVDLEVFSDPVPGKNLTLTIDERIQYVADRALKDAVRANHARMGSVVVMNPKNGDILAMSSYPTFTPGQPPSPKEPLENRINQAISAPFEPGSVFKVITMAAGLETTSLRPGTLLHCGNGSMTLFRRVIHDAKPHGLLSVADILAKSSNIGTIQVGLRVGNEKMHQYVRRFGFGQKCGVPLPGESGGMVWPLKKWIPSSIGSVAMGHEVTASTLQLARAASVVANGGLLVKPRLILSRQRPGEKIETEPAAEPVKALRPETAITMRQMMEGVVLHGTGKRARLAAYTSGGKTGSAQIYDHALRAYTHTYNASFMGFAPVNNPAIVVVVTINGTRNGSAGFGGVVAAPVFQEVATAALRYLDIPKDLPDGELPPDDGRTPVEDLAIASLGTPPEPELQPVAQAALAQAAVAPLSTAAFTPPLVQPSPVAPPAVPAGTKVPDFQGKTLRAVISESAALGMPVEFRGSGIARLQQPPPGAVLRPGETVRIVFAR